MGTDLSCFSDHSICRSEPICLVREWPPQAVLDRAVGRNGHAGLFVPKPTLFVVYLANVLLGLQLGVWRRPPKVRDRHRALFLSRLLTSLVGEVPNHS